MQSKQGINWRIYGLEFLSVFIAVVSAFALSNWNDNRREILAESKMLMEIANGLEKDIEDVKMNEFGHKHGIKASRYFKRILSGE